MDIILGLGVLLLLGLAGGKVSHRLGLPAVTGYILMGLFLGPSGTGIIGEGLAERLLPINSFALSFIAFALGGELKRERLHRLGKSIVQIPLLESLVVFLTVTITLHLLGQPLYVGLLLGSLSIATAPGPLVAIIQEHRSRGPMSDILLTTTAIDNLITIILFGLILSLARLHILERGGGGFLLLQIPLLQILLSILWGGSMGLLLHFSVSRSRFPGETLSLIFAVILFASGMASHLELSALLSLMTMGFLVANSSRENRRIFNALDSLMIPLLIAFLTLGGVHLDTTILKKIGTAGIGAVAARIGGKVIGAGMGIQLANIPPSWKDPLLGLGLTPKAGVSIGLGIIAENTLPLLEGRLLATVLFMVIIFEIIGPPLTVLCLKRAGEIP